MLVTLWIYDDVFPFGMIVNKDVILAFNLKIKVNNDVCQRNRNPTERRSSAWRLKGKMTPIAVVPNYHGVRI